MELEAYSINGSNYVKLRDIGEAVGFNVYWQDGVQIDSDAPYTGDAPAADADGTVTLPTDGSRYIPQAGDVILCDDGTEYTITDVSRWDRSMFASQSFWPWRESELERLFNSCPPGTYYMEAWDVFCDGTFLYTQYKVYAL